MISEHVHLSSHILQVIPSLLRFNWCSYLILHHRSQATKLWSKHSRVSSQTFHAVVIDILTATCKRAAKLHRSSYERSRDHNTLCTCPPFRQGLTGNQGASSGGCIAHYWSIGAKIIMKSTGCWSTQPHAAQREQGRGFCVCVCVVVGGGGVCLVFFFFFWRSSAGTL